MNESWRDYPWRLSCKSSERHRAASVSISFWTQIQAKMRWRIARRLELQKGQLFVIDSQESRGRALQSTLWPFSSLVVSKSSLMLSKSRPRPKLLARMKSPSKIRDHEIKATLLIRDRPTRVVQQLRFNSKGQHVDRTGIASDSWNRQKNFIQCFENEHWRCANSFTMCTQRVGSELIRP